MTSQELERSWIPNPNGEQGKRYSPSEIEAQALEALRLKILGWSDVDIGKAIAPGGLTRQTVAKRIKHAIATHGAPTVAEYREVGKQRYEALIREALTDVTPETKAEAIRIAGDLNAKLMRLVGAEAPVQAEVHVTVETEQEKQLRDLLAQAERDEKVRESQIVDAEVVE